MALRARSARRCARSGLQAWAPGTRGTSVSDKCPRCPGGESVDHRRRPRCLPIRLHQPRVELSVLRRAPVHGDDPASVRTDVVFARPPGGRQERRATPPRSPGPACGSRDRCQGRPARTPVRRSAEIAECVGGVTWRPLLSRAWWPEGAWTPWRYSSRASLFGAAVWQPCGERRVGWGWEAWRRSAYAEGSQGRDVRAAWGPVLFPTHSPRQGDEVAINLHTSLSGGHYRLIEESFNSSLAHTLVMCP